MASTPNPDLPEKGKISEKEFNEVIYFSTVTYATTYTLYLLQGYFRSCPVFLKLPHADFDIPIPPQYVRPSGGIYSTHESMVRRYRHQLSLALLGVHKTADNVSQARCLLHPPPDTEGYKLVQSLLGKQRRIDYIQPDGNCLLEHSLTIDSLFFLLSV